MTRYWYTMMRPNLYFWPAMHPSVGWELYSPILWNMGRRNQLLLRYLDVWTRARYSCWRSARHSTWPDFSGGFYCTPKECSESNTAGSGHTPETDTGPILCRSTCYYNPTDRFGLCVCEVCNLGGRSVILIIFHVFPVCIMYFLLCNYYDVIVTI